VPASRVRRKLAAVPGRVGATGRCAVVIFTVGCWRGCGPGGRRRFRSGDRRWCLKGCRRDNNLWRCGWAVSGIVFWWLSNEHGEDGNCGNGRSAIGFPPLAIRRGCNAGVTERFWVRAVEAVPAPTYPYSFSIDSAVILSTVLEWLFTG